MENINVTFSHINPSISKPLTYGEPMDGVYVATCGVCKTGICTQTQMTIYGQHKDSQRRSHTRKINVLLHRSCVIWCGCTLEYLCVIWIQFWEITVIFPTVHVSNKHRYSFCTGSMRLLIMISLTRLLFFILYVQILQEFLCCSWLLLFDTNSSKYTDHLHPDFY